MRVASHLARAQRRVPQQERGERRVAALLEAAESVIATAGYEAATMSEIAERAGAPIGSLYQFFPNKQSIAQALRLDYCRRCEEMWSPLRERAKSLDVEAWVELLINLNVDFVEQHPAFLPLLDAPASTRIPAPMRQVFRDLVAGFVMAKRPDVRKSRALQYATVVLQIVRSFNQLYAEADVRERRYFRKEFRDVLACYLKCRLGGA
jgi:AcrR family transcriptional regulator